MSDAPPPDRAATPPRGPGAAAPLTPDRVEAVLADFRAWLTDLANHPPADPEPVAATPQVDLFTLVGQFTALRHDVNLQTKAVRAAVEQNADTLKQLAALTPTRDDEEGDDEPVADDSESLRPLVKSLLDVADALAVSLRQMEKLREAVEPLLADLTAAELPPPAPPPGFFARLLASAPPPAARPGPNADAAAEKLRQLAGSAADGYAMSLRRVERALAAAGLEPIPAAGRPFDPDLMEVVDTAADTGESPGTVVEAMRAGYRWRGRVFRYAQVKVAR